MSADLRREILFEPGCHGLSMRWLLHGDQGTIQFLVYTSWLPSWVKPGAFGLTVDTHSERLFGPMGADLGHHWDTPAYEGESQMPSCDVRPGGACFYDGSGLAADDLLGVLLTEGHEAVWERMGAEYARLAAEVPA